MKKKQPRARPNSKMRRKPKKSFASGDGKIPLPRISLERLEVRDLRKSLNFFKPYSFSWHFCRRKLAEAYLKLGEKNRVPSEQTLLKWMTWNDFHKSIPDTKAT